MKHFLLIYNYAPDYLEKRAAYRPAHIALAHEAAARDELQLGGAVPSDAPPFGLLLFKGETPQAAEDFARDDPYVIHGVVTSWRVREWARARSRKSEAKKRLSPPSNLSLLLSRRDGCLRDAPDLFALLIDTFPSRSGRSDLAARGPAGLGAAVQRLVWLIVRHGIKLLFRHARSTSARVMFLKNAVVPPLTQIPRVRAG